MKSKKLFYLALVFAFALLAFVAVQKSRTPAKVAEKPVEKSLYLVVASDMTAGQFVEHSNLEWRVWPGAGNDPQLSRYFKKGQETEVVGRLVRTAVKAGDFLPATALLRAGDVAFLAAVLKPGLRAITIPIDAVSGSAGLIQPGNQVDVILSSNRDSTLYGQGGDYQARTLISNARVIAIDRRIESRVASAVVEQSSHKAGTATLEVTPKQAEMLSLARGLGQLSLSLRSLLEEGGEEVHGITHARELIPELARAPVATSHADPAPAAPVIMYGTEGSGHNHQH